MDAPRHSAPLRLEGPDAGQRKELIVDFVYPVVMTAFIAAFPLDQWLTEVQTLAAAGSAALAALVFLWLRVGRVHAELVGDVLVLRNVLWSYRVPLDAIRAVVSRRAWFGGIYSSCFGVRTDRGLGRLRSVAIHAWTGEGRQLRELETVLVADRA
jgi:hypothetical protein